MLVRKWKNFKTGAVVSQNTKHCVAILESLKFKKEQPYNLEILPCAYRMH